jgi:hypothetical protein
VPVVSAATPKCRLVPVAGALGAELDMLSELDVISDSSVFFAVAFRVPSKGGEGTRCPILYFSSKKDNLVAAGVGGVGEGAVLAVGGSSLSSCWTDDIIKAVAWVVEGFPRTKVDPGAGSLSHRISKMLLLALHDLALTRCVRVLPSVGVAVELARLTRVLVFSDIILTVTGIR